MLGVAGLIGAGRTELARKSSSASPRPTRERSCLMGRSVTVDSPGKAVEMGIAYVPEDRRRHGVILEMSVATNATLATLRAISNLGLLDFRVRNARLQPRPGPTGWAIKTAVRSMTRWEISRAATSRRWRWLAG